MTVIPALAVVAAGLPFWFAAGALGARWVAVRTVPVGVEPVYAPQPVLPKQVNRQAASSAVLSRPWADTDRQAVPLQLSPAERPIGAHRVHH